MTNLSNLLNCRDLGRNPHLIQKCWKGVKKKLFIFRTALLILLKCSLYYLYYLLWIKLQRKLEKNLKFYASYQFNIDTIKCALIIKIICEKIRQFAKNFENEPREDARVRNI